MGTVDGVAMGAASGNQSSDHWTLIERSNMLYTIAVILIVLWLLGLVTSYTMGGFVHVLLVIAVIMVLLRVINGNSPF